HEGCLVSILWWATCIVAKQGWSLKWVLGQMGEGAKPQLVGAVAGEEEAMHSEASKESGSEGESNYGEEDLALFVKVGPLQRRTKELAVAKGKQQVSPSSEAGPSNRPWGDTLMASLPIPYTFLLWSVCSTFNLLAMVSHRAVLPLVVTNCKLSALNLMLHQQIEELMKTVTHQRREVQDLGVAGSPDGDCNGDCRARGKGEQGDVE
ncbi:hypothetical protein C0993_007367, partial [Termitomyces sp. T159_Od127]